MTERQDMNQQDANIRHLLASAITDAGRQRKLPDVDVARELGISRAAYHRVTSHQVGKLSLSKLIEYADKLGLEVELTVKPRTSAA
ncbi:XRE family transcriptional regulator [Nocardia sp. NPDC056611]|uniref:XRE family transcriptional regulator n=1 Tax=Nocardia sp. NPDC056611 TaxID=3345877 RepID=UPI00366C898D